MSIKTYKHQAVIRIKVMADALDAMIKHHPANLSAGNIVLDELLRLKGEVRRSLERLGG